MLVLPNIYSICRSCVLENMRRIMYLKDAPIHIFSLPIWSWYLNLPIRILFRYQNSVCFNIVITVDFIWGWNKLLSTGKYDIGQTSVVKLRGGAPFNFSANLVDTRLYSSGSTVLNNYLLDGKLYRGCKCSIRLRNPVFSTTDNGW